MERLKSPMEESVVVEIRIPKDIIVDILGRLPLKELARFKCVSKEWNITLIPNVIATVTDKNHQKLILLAPKGYKSIILDYEGPLRNVMPLDFPLEVQQGIKVVGSCNGLLCVARNNEPLVLWNPYTKDFKVFIHSSRDLYTNYNESCSCGFGYDSSANEYKVVRFYDCDEFLRQQSLVEIYEMRKNYWRKIKSRPKQFYICGLDKMSRVGTLVNGVLYWRVNILRTNTRRGAMVILSFNLKDEKFAILDPPCDFDRRSRSDLMVFGGRLCLAQNHIGRYIDVNERLNFYDDIIEAPGVGMNYPGRHTEVPKRCIEIWMLEQGNEWTKLMKIAYDLELLPSNKYLVPLCFKRNGKVLMDTRNIVESCMHQFYFGGEWSCLYDPQDKAFIKYKVPGIWVYADRITYRESIVSPYCMP